MTDARLRGEWIRSMRFDLLTDKSWRVFSYALMWSAENGTNGFIPERYRKLLHADGYDSEVDAELAAANLWSKARGMDGLKGYQLTDWDGVLGQSTSLQVETYKASARNRQRKYREKERAKLERVTFTEAPVTSDVTRDVMGEMTSDVGKGEEQRHRDTREIHEQETKTETWAVADIPKGKVCRVCQKSIPAASPVEVCGIQDEEHNFARSNASAA